MSAWMTLARVTVRILVMLVMMKLLSPRWNSFSDCSAHAPASRIFLEMTVHVKPKSKAPNI